MSRLKLAIAIGSGLVIGGFSALALLPGNVSNVIANPGKSIGQALVGGPFTLTAHDGRRVTDKDFRGKFMLVYFGFTFCPEICPSALQVMAAALQELGPKAERIVPVLITLDPERDTAPELARYVQSFHPRLVGLTGTPDEIASVAKEYRVYYKKVKDEKSSAPYTVDHTSLIYVMDPSGAYVSHFSHATPVEQIVERLRKVL